MQASIMPCNLMRVVETKTEDGKSSTRVVEPLPFVVYGQRASKESRNSNTNPGRTVNGRPVTPLEEYFPGKRFGQANECPSQASSQSGESVDKSTAEKFVHYGAGFSNTSPPARCHFIVHPDWVSERRRGVAGLKGAAGSQKVSARGLQYGSG